VIFRETELKGAFVIEAELREDERGFFARTWCQREFEARGLKGAWVQGNISGNRRGGTLRGMHYQVEPHGEIKLVRCTSGSLYDVIVDLRPESSTYLKHVGVELTTRNRKMLYIPEGMAHGFQTLEDNTEICYLMSAFYTPECARGVRWDDPVFGIRWPPAVRTISARDQSFPDYQPVSH
jgi:dTDP-4-dehydrorhamnose 3,5-epimerase